MLSGRVVRLEKDTMTTSTVEGTIKECGAKDAGSIYAVINDAAKSYQGFIQDDCYHEPYMLMDELLDEMRQMTFFSYIVDRELVGLTGLQRVKDATLVRHTYVLRLWQRKGIGSKLLRHGIELAATKKILVGTWAKAYWAINFYQKHGFKLLLNKDELLLRYWKIPDKQREASVVLGLSIDNKLAITR